MMSSMRTLDQQSDEEDRRPYCRRFLVIFADKRKALSFLFLYTTYYILHTTERQSFSSERKRVRFETSLSASKALSPARWPCLQTRTLCFEIKFQHWSRSLSVRVSVQLAESISTCERKKSHRSHVKIQLIQTSGKIIEIFDKKKRKQLDK